MSNIATKLTYLNGTKQAIKQAINEDFEVIDNNTTFREYADEISSNNAKYKDLIPKETKNATNTLDISNCAGLDKALVTLYGNTYQEGEPTPDSPQEIQVVTGDNSINVCGKNLIGLGTQLNGYVDQSTLKFQTNPSSIGYYFETSKLPNTITFSSINGNRANVCYFSEIPAYQSVCALRSASNDNPRTITVDKTYPYIHIQFSYNYQNVTNIQIESGSTATEYEPYQSQSYHVSLGNIELCKIGNYKDKIAKSSGKNKLSGNFVIGSIDSYGADFGNTNRARSEYISIDENTTYRFSSSNSNIYYVPYYYDESKTFISFDNGWKQQSVTFTTPSGTKYLRILVKNNNTDSITLGEITEPMINKGTTALPYEPYGKVWYLNKQIGKVVLDGSENWGISSGNFYMTSISNYKRSENKPYSNYYQGTLNTDSARGITNGQIAFNKASEFNRFYLSNTSISSVNDIKDWLSTHNTEVYYVLATPTTTEITENNYPTLYNQLNNIKLFEGVNHITMTNESGLDVDFDITYYKDWKLD